MPIFGVDTTQIERAREKRQAEAKANQRIVDDAERMAATLEWVRDRYGTRLLPPTNATAHGKLYGLGGRSAEKTLPRGRVYW